MNTPINSAPIERSREELIERIEELERKLGEVAYADLETQLNSMYDAQRSMEEARERYANLYDDAPVCYFTLDQRGVIRNLNLTAARLLGLERGSILGRPFSVWVCREDKSLFYSHLTAANLCRHDAEIRLCLSKEKTITVRIESICGAEIIGDQFVLQTVIIDITRRKQTEQELQTAYRNIERQVTIRTEQLSSANRELEESQLRVRALLDSSPDFAWLKDLDGNYLAMNKAFADYFHLMPGELVGKKDVDLWDNATSDKCHSDEIAVQSTGQLLRAEETLTSRSGVSVFVESIKVPILDHGKVIGTACVARDIGERKTAQDRIQYLAHYDTLTGLPNRELLNERFDLTLASAHRNGEQIAVLFVDLDYFKAVNDEFGHRVGDLLLIEVAERLKKSIREVDTVARFGGDEFIVVTSHLNTIADASRIAEKILSALGEPYSVMDHEPNISCSVGISLYPRDGFDKESLVKHADAAMYHAKEMGRNGFQFFDQGMALLDAERSEVGNRLQRALTSGEFELNYQPIVDVSSGKVTGCEALLRLRYEGVAIPPIEFIPAAEKSGMIYAIGAWVLLTACRQNRAWQDAGLPLIPISVNLSAVQFRQSSLADDVAHVLRETGLSPHFLELELTETTIMNNCEATLLCLDELKKLGVKISIDDFGTGYSSLSYLRNFPIDKLKIDQSFVSGIGSGTKNMALTGAIITMAKLMDIGVTAEGVETIEQLSTLRTQGCDYAQGYYCSFPLTAAAFTEFLSTNAGQHSATSH